MEFVQPKIITSPISGYPSRPQIITFERDGKIYEEAIWRDFRSGEFIRKGVVSITDKKTGKRQDIYTRE